MLLFSGIAETTTAASKSVKAVAVPSAGPVKAMSVPAAVIEVSAPVVSAAPEAAVEAAPVVRCHCTRMCLCALDLSSFSMRCLCVCPTSRICTRACWCSCQRHSVKNSMLCGVMTSGLLFAYHHTLIRFCIFHLLFPLSPLSLFCFSCASSSSSSSLVLRLIVLLLWLCFFPAGCPCCRAINH